MDTDLMLLTVISHYSITLYVVHDDK